MMTHDTRDEVVSRFGDMVWRLALARMANVPDAEDVFQEVFLRYFRHEQDFTSDEHRRAWLIRCTVNRTRSALTAPWRRRTLPLEEAVDLARDVGVAEESRAVYAAVLALPPKYRTVVHLHYFEGYAVAEIADQLGVAPGTVKSRLHRARTMLRDALSDIAL